jgi:hypothetical protein
MKRVFLWSLAGASTLVLPFVALALLVVFGQQAGDESDNAPMRVAGIIFVLSPFVFVGLTIAFLSVGTAVRWIRRHMAARAT